MSELFEPTLDELIACVEREIRLREFVYPKRVADRRMSADKSSRELMLMRAVASKLYELHRSAKP